MFVFSKKNLYGGNFTLLAHYRVGLPFKGSNYKLFSTFIHNHGFFNTELGTTSYSKYFTNRLAVVEGRISSHLLICHHGFYTIVQNILFNIHH